MIEIDTVGYLLMNTDMVRATNKGRKTVTRRLDPERYLKWKKGDVVYVREKFRYFDMEQECPHDEPCYYIRAHGKPIYYADCLDSESKWKPSIHMPRKDARLFLRLTEDVHKERLQEITEDDAISEGILLYNGWESSEFKKLTREAIKNNTKPPPGFTPRMRFHHLWDSVYKEFPNSWMYNPEVAVIRFERV